VFLLGSGKGTLCEKIAKIYNYEHVSVGDLLRDEKACSKHSELIKEYQIEGKIVPAEITIGSLKSKISELNSSGVYNILLDGFPCNSENLEYWNQIVGDSVKLEYVIYLNCSEDTMIDRVLKRGKTSGRMDDNEESVVKRIKVFNEQSLPVIKYYEKLNFVKQIDSCQTPEKVFDDVKKIFTMDS